MKTHKENIDDIIHELSVYSSQSALKTLYVTYFNQLIKFVILYVDSTVVAEEIVSDVFLAVWNNRKTLTNISNFNSYVYKIAKYKSIDYLRSRRTEQIELGEIPIDAFTRTVTTPENDLISKENIIQLNEAIDKLPVKYKLAFKLVREDKMKYKEVASILNVSIKTIEAYITHSVKTLREVLKQNMQSE